MPEGQTVFGFSNDEGCSALTIQCSSRSRFYEVLCVSSEYFEVDCPPTQDCWKILGVRKHEITGFVLYLGPVHNINVDESSSAANGLEKLKM